MSQKNSIAVRSLTQDEEAHFHGKGWAKIASLISVSDAQRMLAGARDVMSRAEKQQTHGSGRLEDCWFSWDHFVFEARQMTMNPFPELALSPEMGSIASRLINRCRLTDERIPIRCLGGVLFCKVGGSSLSGRELPYHQDGPAFKIDRPGLVTVWVALDEVTPEQGAMRFMEGSHTEGSLGTHLKGYPVRRYPKLLEQYRLSEPLHYAAGDATVHDGFTLHGSPENATNQVRWAYLCMYIADDVQFNAETYEAIGFAKPSEKYPVVFS